MAEKVDSSLTWDVETSSWWDTLYILFLEPKPTILNILIHVLTADPVSKIKLKGCF